MNHFFYRPDVELIAGRHGLDADLIEAMIWQESTGDPHARRVEPKFWQRYLKDHPLYRDEHWLRWSSSLGLMQILPSTAVETGVVQKNDPGMPELLFQPQMNIEIGCTFVKQLIAWAGGDVRKAIAAYNAGRGGWSSPAGQAYADKVLAKYALVKAKRAA